MKNEYGKHNALVSHARTLGDYCHKHKLKGIEVAKGVKVSSFISLFEKEGSNWLWSMLDSMVGGIDISKYKILAPAVFLFNLQYKLQKDRSEKRMRECNYEFLFNCILCIKDYYCFVNPRRYMMIHMAKALFALVEANCIRWWNGRGVPVEE